MDYGDEFNDAEEKRYRKETYGDGKGDDENESDKEGSGEEGEEEGEEEESSFDPPEVVPLAKDFSRRANRGNRMSALVSKAVDEDEDDFWGGIGKEFFGGGLDDDVKEGE